MAYTENVRVGTLVPVGMKSAEYIRQILPHGFESFEINFWKNLGDTDLKALAPRVREVLAGTDAVISSLGIYGNPLTDDAEGKLCREGWKKCIDATKDFGCDIVAGFAGRIVDQPIPASMKQYKKVFGPLAQRAADKGVRIAFENCEMGGNWKTGGYNIAHTPDAWEMMFNELPADNIGLEWEPCHQMVKLIDPLPQLRKWIKKVFHLHGKDATIRWDVIRENGIGGPVQWNFHRTPGFGDSNWTDIISILRQGGFVGAIDIEGWHDPVYREGLEMMGQVRGLNYLKACRGGQYVENPKV